MKTDGVTDEPTTRLPNPLSSFVGRARELERARELLAQTRLLTLTGLGGCGKTRLALELARAAGPAWWVDLAGVADPTLVAATVASALGLKEEPFRSLEQKIIRHLRTGPALVVLDDCEHLIDACAALSRTILTSCAEAKVLATSREPLRVEGETVWTVPPLALPEPSLTGEAASTDAVALFVERATSARPDFRLTEENAGLVAHLCRSLEGLPLAIELAAARMRTSGIDEIVAGLTDRLGLLAGGPRGAPPRQQTLRGSLDWSYDLLTQPERILFERLSVFAGGFALDSVQAVCCGDSLDERTIGDHLGLLVDRSLVGLSDRGGTSRYAMLETIREYAREKLITEDEKPLRDRHLKYMAGLAERAEPSLTASDQATWFDRLDAEGDNISAALSWGREASRSEATLRLAGALTLYWVTKGSLSEGRQRLEQALVAPGGSAERRAKVLWGAAYMASWASDIEAVHANGEQALALARTIGDRSLEARSLMTLGWPSIFTASPAAARDLFEPARALAHDIGDAWCEAEALQGLGLTHVMEGSPIAARPPLEECITLARETGNGFSALGGLVFLGWAYLWQGDIVRARSVLDDASQEARRRQDMLLLPLTLALLGSAHLGSGEFTEAQRLLEEALERARDSANPFSIANALWRLADLHNARGDPSSARPLLEEALIFTRAWNRRLHGQRPGESRGRRPPSRR